MKIFLSSRYSRKEELKDIRDYLRSNGYEVCSRWLDTDWSETERDAIYSSVCPPEHRREYAQIDVDDVKECDVFISFTEEPKSSSRGGRHVELGVAIALEKKIIVIGPRENLFHHHPLVLVELQIKYGLVRANYTMLVDYLNSL